MLSKKIAFSLISLITIFVLAFVVPSAMAQDFDTTLSVQDISFADSNQVEVTNSATNVIVNAAFAKVVNQADIHGKVTLLVYNKFGGLLATPTIDAGSIGTGVRHDGKTYTITFQLTATIDDNTNPYRAKLYIGEGIVAAAPDDDRSQATDIEMYLVAPDPTPSNPMPVSIKFANNLLVPADGFTGASFDIIVTLSEEPKGGKFTKDHLDVVKGSAAGGVYLGPIDPPEGETATGRSGDYHRFLFTITPKVEDSDLVIKIKSFEDQEKPIPNKYTPPATDIGRTEGKDMVTVKIGKRVPEDVIIVIEVPVPRDTIIPSVGDPIPAQNGGDDNTEAAATVAAGEPKAEPPAATATAVDAAVMIPMEGRIYISEIMFAGGGTLPQWIEISNGSRTEQVNLSGWTLTVENATADTDVSVGAKAVFTIPEETRIDPSGQNDTPSMVLVVTEQGRTNLSGRVADGQILNLWVDRQAELIRLNIFKRRYSLLSDMAFRIVLTPPVPDMFAEQAVVMRRKAATDVVGNLADDGTVAWTLPTSEGSARSSIIRRHVSAEPKDGEMMESWVLASDTGFAQGMHVTTRSYYGLPIDIGTPGFRAGGALPVELSHFRPARNKETGQVVITWSTQSELNNAGFFIKRSQQQNGKFVVISPLMIPGAGTTSKKQFYTYTDTTARPKVVYYYQIEDVSFDGERRVLTRGIRLRGHVGAAGKATVTWGELKTSNE